MTDLTRGKASALAKALLILVTASIAAQPTATAQGPPADSEGEAPAAKLVCQRAFSKSPVADTVEIDNLHSLELQAVIYYREQPPWQLMNALRLDFENDEGCTECRKVRIPNLRLRVYRVDGGVRLPVKSRVFSSGGAGSARPPGFAWADGTSFRLWIPSDPEKRAEKFSAFLEKLRAQGEAQEAADYQQEYDRKPDLVLDYLDQENEPGEYELVCEYHPQEWSYWKAELVSPPLKIKIKHVEDWYDVILRNMRKKPQ